MAISMYIWKFFNGGYTVRIVLFKNICLHSVLL
jgi:hypothetical protein